MAERKRKVNKTWWAFRAGMWVLMVTGAALIIFGQFWPGLIALMCAATVRIAWGEWSRRKQALFDSDANEARQ